MTATTKGRNFDTGDVVLSDAGASTFTEAGTVTVQAGSDLQIIYRDPADLVAAVAASVELPEPTFASMANRLVDIGIASIALVASAPVWLVVALISGLQRGPILYSQQRIGRGGRIFQCWKFRTMHVDAEIALQQLLADDPEFAQQWAANSKLDHDPRVTPLGRILRRFDLDEIPQFFNVLIGDMSVVGPRPLPLHDGPKFGRSLATVVQVRPGLTGVWQVSGRNSMTYEERVATEVTYVETRSFLNDLMICARTPLALLRSNNGR